MPRHRYRAHLTAASNDELAANVERYGAAVRDVGMEPVRLHLLARAPEDARVQPASLDGVTQLLRAADDVRMDPDLRYEDPETGTAATLAGTRRRDAYRVGVAGDHAQSVEAARDAVADRMELEMDRPGPLDRLLDGIADAYDELLC